jgi:hypothetical protein
MASSASWLRWAGLRWSRVAVSAAGSLSTVGWSSSGLLVPGGGELGQDRFEDRPHLRGEVAADGAHPVGALLGEGDTALAFAVGVGEVAVGMQERVEQVHGLAQALGAVVAGDADEVGLGGDAGGRVDAVGQFGEELADEGDVLGGDRSRALSGGGLREDRGQGLPGEGAAGAEVGGLADAAGGFAGADAEAVGQQLGRRGGAVVDRVDLGDDPVEDAVIDRRHRAPGVLDGVEGGDEFGVAGGVDVGGQQIGHRGAQGLRRVHQIDCHGSNTSTRVRQVGPSVRRMKPL